MTPPTWLLITWLCTGPGPAGECAPQPDQAHPTLSACRAAARAAEAAIPERTTHCRRERPG